MPRRPQFPEECAHCGRLADHLVKGRCNTCYSYLRKNGRERPLWERGTVTWEKVGPDEAPRGEELCERGQPVAWRLGVPIMETARTRLYLCSECAELERALSLSSSWSD